MRRVGLLRLATTVSLAAVIGFGTTACGILDALPTATPVPPPLPDLPFASAPAESPDDIRDAVIADGWRAIGVDDAGIGFYVPDDWYVDLVHEPGLGDFEDLPPGSESREDAVVIGEEVADGRELLLVYGQSGDHALAASDPVILQLSGWRDFRGQTLVELVEILAEDRLARTEIADRATVETGLGEAQRLHRWWAEDGDLYSTVEFVFFAPDGEAYTLSLLTAESLVDEMWPIFSRIGASLHPLD